MTENLTDFAARAATAIPTAAREVVTGIDVVALWPDLFHGLDERQRNAIRAAFAANWHEGWTPNRDDVADLAAQTRGEVDTDEYFRRADERAQHARTAVR